MKVDWRGASEFRVRCSELARAIGNGEARTYGDLARELGSSARSVGRTMATNPYVIVVRSAARSTMRADTPARASVAAMMRPVGPAPTTDTSTFVIEGSAASDVQHVVAAAALQSKGSSASLATSSDGSLAWLATTVSLAPGAASTLPTFWQVGQ